MAHIRWFGMFGHQSMDWYYAENSKKIGPVTQENIQELWNSGKIKPDTLVWHEGLSEWKPLKEFNDKIDFETHTQVVPELPSAVPSVETFEADGYYYFRRLLAYIIDFVLILIVAFLPAWNGYIAFHEDGEALRSGYMNLFSDYTAQRSSEAQTSEEKKLTQQELQTKTEDLISKHPDFFLYLVLCLIVIWVLTDSLLTLFCGGSLGKLILGLRTRLADGQEINFNQAMAKALFRMAISAGMVIPQLELLFIILHSWNGFVIFSSKGKTSMGDRIAKTRVLPSYIEIKKSGPNSAP